MLIPSFQNSELLKWIKWQFLELKDDPLTQIDYTQNESGRNNLKFQHCVFPMRLPMSVPIFAKLEKMFDFQYGVAWTNACRYF